MFWPLFDDKDQISMALFCTPYQFGLTINSYIISGFSVHLYYYALTQRQKSKSMKIWVKKKRKIHCFLSHKVLIVARKLK